ncbi:MAG: hypothetical protein ICV83_10705, partial [Cytophagales bacterium]|nr:hypothetical protein [Cytophagales bacterium]
MFAHILRFELRYRFRQPATYAYFGVLFLIAFVFMAVEKTFFGPPTGGKVFKNAPEIIASLMLGSAFALFFVAPLAGTPVYRDFKENTYPLLFTTPLRKADYLGGRFVGSLLASWFVMCGIAAGAVLGTLMPWNDPARYTAFEWAAYWQPLVYFGFGNAFFCACIFFAAYAFTRNALVLYVGGLALFLTWAVSRIMARGIENESLASLLDAFGFTPHSLTVRYWTIAQRNSLLVPVGEYILPNRLLWCGVGLGLLLLSCLAFRMKAPAPRIKKRAPRGEELPPRFVAKPLPLGSTLAFGVRAQWRQFRQLTGMQFGYVVRSVPFLGIAVFGAADLLISAYYTWSLPQFRNYPVTYQVLELTDDAFRLYFLIIILIYAGELVWRERDLKVHGVFDALPVPDWVPFAAKGAALVGVQALLLLLLTAVGVGIQAASGYYHFEWTLYASDFLINLAWCFQLCVLCLAVQVLVNHKYVGYAVVIGYYIAWYIAADGLGIEHVLVQFGKPVAYQYSDMN